MLAFKFEEINEGQSDCEETWANNYLMLSALG